MSAERGQDVQTAIAGRLRKDGLDATVHAAGGSLRLETQAAPDGSAVPSDTEPHLPHITLADGGAAPAAGLAGADLVVGAELGSGGMGVVHTAFQRSLDRDLAIKRTHGVSSGQAALVREARTTARVEGPHVVPIHALGQTKTGAVLLMKRVEGTSWQALLRDTAHPAWAALHERWQEPLDAHVAILTEVCDALTLAHARGVVHLDVKPDNVLVGPFGEVYLVDWGIARRLDEAPTDAIVGTPAYIAPEMVLAPSDVDARTDVYLLGATLHHVLTGRPPHRGESLVQTLFHATEPVPSDYDASVPDDLAMLAQQAMEVNPSARPQTVARFRHTLGEHERHRAATALAEDAARAIAKVAPTGSVPLDSPEAGRLLLEARMGLVAAIKTCSESRPARRGMRACLERAIAREIELRAPAAARALALELDDPPPALVTRISAIEAELALGDEARARLERARRDADSSPGYRTGMALMGTGLLVMVLTHGYFGLGESTGSSAPVGPILLVEVCVAVVLGVVGAVLHRAMSAASGMVMRLFALQQVLVAAQVVSDASVWVRGGDTSEATPQALVVFAAGLAVASIGVARGLAISSLTMLVFAVISSLHLALPDAPSLLRAVAMAVLAVVTAAVMRRHASESHAAVLNASQASKPERRAD